MTGYRREHMRSKIAICTLFYFVAFISSKGQDYIRPGYLIKNGSDTLKGFIRDMEWDENPKVISFQAEKNSPPENYTIDSIKAFFTDRPVHFERYSVKYDGDKMLEGDYPSTREPSHSERLLCLRSQVSSFRFLSPT